MYLRIQIVHDARNTSFQRKDEIRVQATFGPQLCLDFARYHLITQQDQVELIVRSQTVADNGGWKLSIKQS
jgi:hypothetical protein